MIVSKFFIDDTKHRVEGAQRPQQTPCASFALISKDSTYVVGGARDVNGVDMWRGWGTVTLPDSKPYPPPCPGTADLCWA